MAINNQNASNPNTRAGQINDEIKDTARIVEDALKNIAESVRDAFDDAVLAGHGAMKSLEKDIYRSLQRMSRIGDQLNKNQEKLAVGLLKEREVRKQILNRQAQMTTLIERLRIAKENGAIADADANKQYLEALRINTEFVESLEKQRKAAISIRDTMGALGDIVKGLGRIPILGNLIKTEEVLEEMELKAAQAGSTRFGVMITGLKEIGKSLVKNIADPLTLITFLGSKAFQINQQLVNIGKSLIVNRDAAKDIRKEVSEWAFDSGDIFMTTKNLLEANTSLSKYLGVNRLYSKDMNEQFVNFTKKMGVSEEAASKLALFTTIMGKSLKQTKLDVLSTTQSVSSQYGIQLDHKSVIEEIGKISGQLLANLKGNPKALAEAVSLSRMFGTNLETVKKQADYLLDFESSIESELKAELLIGKSLNYERARSAALQGDMVTAMKELNNQGITWNKFQNMNVIAQKALAESMGLSADQLADQLMKQEFLHKSKQQILALGGEEVAQRMEQMSAQDKFNAAVEKLSDLLGNMLAGPLGGIMNVMGALASNSTLVYSMFGAIAGLMAGKMLTGLIQMIGKMVVMVGLAEAEAVAAVTTASAMTLGIGILGVIAGITAAVAAMKSAKVDDGVIGPQGKILYTAQEGAIKLNDDDTVVTGTNLFDKKAENNEGSISNQAMSIDLTPLIQAVNQVKASVDKLYHKESGIYMDSRKVGTTLVQNSHKLA
jgi:hypothetical protein